MSALDPAATAARLFDTKRNLHFFPVRHHSPACALHLREALRAIRPAAVLIEGPVDFEPLIGELLAPGVVPPVAMVALPDSEARAEKGRAGTTYYPICHHSPEYIAIQDAKALGATIRFIDLPSRHPAMLSGGRDRQDQPLLPMRETMFDRGAYVEAMCERTGFRDGLALWDGLFEARARSADWRGFFASVGAYCSALRAASDMDELQADGTLAREAMMRACLRDTIATVSGPIAIITGGFHTPALIDEQPEAQHAAIGAPARSNAWLIRYDYRALDRLNGYGAGLPLPGFYERVWERLTGAKGDSKNSLTEEILVGFRAHLIANEPALTFSFPTLRSMVEAATRLADLRGLSEPGRTELFDALRSSAIKEEIELGSHPLLAAFTSFLQGDRLGDLPPGSRLPPLIERARREARSHGLSLEDAVPKTREFDIYRKVRHRQCSQFLHAMRLVAPAFAERVKGPDRVHGFRADVLMETWTYAWSPAVEASLIERAADGETVRDAAATVLIRRLEDLEKEGQRNNAEAAFNLLSVAFDAGIGSAADTLAAAVGNAARADSNLLRLTRALVVGQALKARAKGMQSEDTVQAFASLLPPLLDQLARRIAELLRDLAAVGPDNVGEAIGSLAALAEAMADPDPPFPTEPLRDALQDLMTEQLDPELTGAVIALAALIGLIDDAEAGRRLSAALAGAFERPGEAVRTVSGVMALAPQLFINDSSVIAAIDHLFGAVDDQGFLDLLPQLRMAFAELSPNETDRIAAVVAAAHGVGEDDIAILRDVPDARVLSDHLALSGRLRSQWLEDGLSAWLEPQP
ncbi:hypothetical protein J6524_20640 [Bradyrhizobium sp. WSM 1738]|uniref:DUF5682 family protein n=1 Tax=Bradyrhizobium hereditatis TaxID=2821405 RepID=UPI001CE2E898|nr:DUF5682 family protein [Bradyrhizobium hereditatis]MCA6117260.1 hypothetical protein [Bradyrhizobium hereditatis]